jgi:hypothetical protein
MYAPHETLSFGLKLLSLVHIRLKKAFILWMAFSPPTASIDAKVSPFQELYRKMKIVLLAVMIVLIALLLRASSLTAVTVAGTSATSQNPASSSRVPQEPPEASRSYCWKILLCTITSLVGLILLMIWNVTNAPAAHQWWQTAA